MSFAPEIDGIELDSHLIQFETLKFNNLPCIPSDDQPFNTMLRPRILNPDQYIRVIILQHCLPDGKSCNINDCYKFSLRLRGYILLVDALHKKTLDGFTHSFFFTLPY